jgi:hypothetical protein
MMGSDCVQVQGSSFGVTDGQSGRQNKMKLKPWRTQMITKSLIAAAAVAISLTALAPVEQAQAKVHVDINLGLGGGFYPGYDYGYGYGGGYYPVVDPYYGGGNNCWQVKHKLQMMNFKHVHPFDCSAPTYRFTAKKFGNPVTVKTNVWGNILAVY